MSTALDLEAFDDALHDQVIRRPDRVLYIGIHESKHVSILRHRWPGVVITTLDADPALRPDVVHNLDAPEPIPAPVRGRGDRRPAVEVYDLVVCASVLMYVEFPDRALDKIIAAGGTSIVQEHVARARPDRDPWPDRNRFFSVDESWRYTTQAAAARGAPGDPPKRLVNADRPCLAAVRHYVNGDPGAISAVWVYKR